tara:strand:- start:344 stop:955 length:612 start_codon:yes stop_codon:yes gene_type:complete
MNLIDDFKKPLGISFPDNREGFYKMAMSYVKKDYDWAEFGVYRGVTAQLWLDQYLPSDKKLYLFDSFEGLPEDWAGVNNYGEKRFSPKGTFALDGIPNFNDDRVVLQVGWFEDTVPTFVKNYNKKALSFVHLDADLYSSTKTVLNGIKHLINPDTIIIFDELCGDPRQQEHEYKAFEEFVFKNNLTPEYICNDKNNRVALRVK